VIKEICSWLPPWLDGWKDHSQEHISLITNSKRSTVVERYVYFNWNDRKQRSRMHKIIQA